MLRYTLNNVKIINYSSIWKGIITIVIEVINMTGVRQTTSKRKTITSSNHQFRETANKPTIHSHENNNEKDCPKSVFGL